NANITDRSAYHESVNAKSLVGSPYRRALMSALQSAKSAPWAVCHRAFSAFCESVAPDLARRENGLSVFSATKSPKSVLEENSIPPLELASGVIATFPAKLRNAALVFRSLIVSQ